MEVFFIVIQAILLYDISVHAALGMSPVVTEVAPMRGPGENKIVGSIRNGGMDLRIIGHNLASVKTITVNLVSRSLSSVVLKFKCKTDTPQLALCKTPYVNGTIFNMLKDDVTKLDGIGYYTTKMELILDKKDHNISSLVPNDNFYISDNPKFDDKDYEWWASGTHNAMHISGKKINYAADIADYKVTIGNKVCTVTGMTSNMLMIIPPNKTEFKANSTDRHFLRIEIGDYSYIPGEVKYVSDSEESSSVMLPIIIVCCLLLLTLVLAGVYFLNRKRKQNQKKKVMMAADNFAGPNENFYSANAPGHDAQGYLQPIQHQTSRVSLVSSQSSGTLRRESVIASLLNRQSVNSLTASLPNSPKSGSQPHIPGSISLWTK